eukprot:scaffold106208_cov13-Prasinocladus_malaysianus.AAC.1
MITRSDLSNLKSVSDHTAVRQPSRDVGDIGVVLVVVICVVYDTKGSSTADDDGRRTVIKASESQARQANASRVYLGWIARY